MRIVLDHFSLKYFPCGSAGKESVCNAGDLGLIPGLGRSPGEGKGYPLQYSGLENSMDCIVHRFANSWTRLSDFHFHWSTVVLNFFKQTIELCIVNKAKSHCTNESSRTFCTKHDLQCPINFVCMFGVLKCFWNQINSITFFKKSRKKINAC